MASHLELASPSQFRRWALTTEDHGDAQRKLSVDPRNLRHNRHSTNLPSTPPPPHADPHSRHSPAGTPTPPDRPSGPKPGTDFGVPSRSLFLATHPQTEKRLPEPDVPLGPNGRSTSIGPPLTSHTPKSTGGLPDDNPSTAKHKRRTRRAGRRRRKGRNSPPKPPHGS